MRTKLHELADAAGIRRRLNNNLEMWCYEHQLEKLVDLIIYDCVRICNNNIDEEFSVGNASALCIREEIKKHFGVE